MNELVFQGANEDILTNSLLVSGKFDKEHKNVMRDIDNLKKDVLNFEQMFLETSYSDTYGRLQRMYVMNRDGFTLLAMGFTGSQALKFKVEYINAFNRMEAKIKTGNFQIPTTFSEALQLAAKQAQAIEEQSKLIEANKTKVLFAEAYEVSDDNILIGTFAKILTQNGYNIGQNRLFEWFRQNGFLNNCFGERHNLPTQKAMDMKLFIIKESIHTAADGTIITTSTPKITPKGQQYFINKFLGHANTTGTPAN